MANNNCCDLGADTEGSKRIISNNVGRLRLINCNTFKISGMVEHMANFSVLGAWVVNLPYCDQRSETEARGINNDVIMLKL